MSPIVYVVGGLLGWKLLSDYQKNSKPPVHPRWKMAGMSGSGRMSGYTPNQYDDRVSGESMARVYRYRDDLALPGAGSN